MQTTTAWWIPILVTIIAGIFSLVGYWLKSFLDNRKYSKSGAMKKYIRLYDELHMLLNEARRDLGASRIAVLKTEDGGGIPKVGSPLYVSVVCEVVDDNTMLTSGEWQKQRVDSGYCSILAKTLSEECVHINVSELCDSCLLHDLYTALALTYVRMCNLLSRDCYSLFLSIGYKEEATSREPYTRIKTLATITAITNIFIEMDKLDG